MTDFTIKVRPDQGNVGSNKIEVFLDTDPKQEIMILTDRGDDVDGWEEEPKPEDTALYYAVERIAQLETQLASVTTAAKELLADYRNAIETMEYPEEAQESRELADALEKELKDD